MTMPVDPQSLVEATPAAAPDDADPLLQFAPAPVRICMGWSARRQRIFIKALAETGSVTEAAETAGVTTRSAYRLRLRPGAEAFRDAWAQAQRSAVEALTSIAFDRAIHGTRRVIHRGNEFVEEYLPSDRLLIFLLRHLDSKRFGNLSGLLPVDVPDPVVAASKALTKAGGDFTDLDAGPEPDAFESFEVHHY